MKQLPNKRLLIGALVLPLAACAARVPRSAPVRPASSERRFSDPTAAVDAFLAACRNDDAAALIGIFGDEARALVSTGDAGADRERCRKFVAAAGEMMRLDPKGTDRLELVVGLDDWPFPIPLVRDDTGWHFDTAQGKQEILRRRVGADELEAIAACRSYVHAQEEYARVPREGGTKAYAQKIASTPGRKDGLYWQSSGPGDESPLGPMIAAASDYAHGRRPAGSWWGYYYRILSAQGPSAPGGARSYLANGLMTGGFALVAYPVTYGETGIMTFQVSRDGRLYQKDLGSDTAAIVERMQAYDPGQGWVPVTD